MTHSNSAARPLALVTGASTGIGFELARLFAENGYDLVIAAESEKLESAREELRTFGTEIHAVRADLASFEGVEYLYQRVQALGRPLDCAALNAGVGAGGDFVHDTDLKKELDLIQLNVVSPVHLAKRILKDMTARGEGRVLFTSSISALSPVPFEAVYGASKAFLQSFAKAIREELKDSGVTITCLLPGATDTNFFHRADMDDTKVGTKDKEGNDPADVAKAGFEALMKGDAEVVAASLKTKLQGLAARVLPQEAAAKMRRPHSEPGSATR